MNIFLLLSLLTFFNCSDKKNETEIDNPPIKETYSNPILNFSMPDPTIMKADNGYFYLYATEDVRNVPIYKSKNLIDWVNVGTAFTESTRPTFEPKGGIWAPDINQINGRYVLYYSMSVWGSFRGIYAIELSDDGLSVKQDAEKQKIAGTAFEGTYIYKKDGYYYLFASIGSCCEGVNSTYRLVVGRSQSLFGSYTDKSGKSMLDNNYELVIGPNDSFVGNGHCSEIVHDDAGNDWIFYHGVDKKRPEGRVLLMDQVKWVDGWPVINNGSPSLESPKPIFNK